MNSPPQSSPNRFPFSPASNVKHAGSAVLVNRSGGVKTPEETYNNAVKRREDLPTSRHPQHFMVIKRALLGISVACIAAAIATLIFGLKVELRQGYRVAGMRDVPFDISTAAVFLGGFAFSVSLTLMAIVYRNWSPVLLTYIFFVLMVIVSNITIFGMMMPGPNLALRRAASWGSMPAELHLQFFEQFNCCGYSRALVNKQPTCNLAAIGKDSGAVQAQVPSAVPPPSAGASIKTPVTNATTSITTPAITTPASTPSRGPAPSTTPRAPIRLARRQQQQQTTAAAGTPATTAAQPAQPAQPVIPQFTNPLPLSSDFSPVGPPTVPSFPPPLPDSGVDFCQNSVDPMLDAVVASIRNYFLVAVFLSMIQLVLLLAFWKLLSKWKMARGVARW